MKDELKRMLGKRAPQTPRRDTARLKDGSLAAAHRPSAAQKSEVVVRAGARPSARPTFKALSDPSPARRILALEMVSRFSGDHALSLLTGMLGDPDASVRRAAASAAARLGSLRLASCLIVALEDPDPSVRDACRRALAVIARRAIDPHDLNDPERRRRVVEELKTWWKRERLAELLADE